MTLVVIDTPEGIAAYRLLALRSALKLEVNTGMKRCGGISVMQLAATACGSAKRTKKGVLADLEAFLAEKGLL